MEGGNIFEDAFNWVDHNVVPIVQKVAPIVTTVAPIVATMMGGKAVHKCGKCGRRVAKNAKKCRHCGAGFFGDIANVAKYAYNKGKQIYDTVEPVAKPLIGTAMTAYQLYNMLKGAGIITAHHEMLMKGGNDHMNVDQMEANLQRQAIAPALEMNGYNRDTKFNQYEFDKEQARLTNGTGGSYPVAGSYPVGGSYRVGGDFEIAGKYKPVHSNRTKEEILESILRKLPK